MYEIDVILRKIKESKKKGEHQLRIERDVSMEAIMELREMGYLVIQVFSHGYIDTIVGWKDNA